MSPRPLVFITTRLPPAICGIGTYSWRLREHWPNDSRAIHFLTIDPGTSPRGDSVTAFGDRPADLERALNSIGDADLLLHYAGRAYHRLGFPFWLARVLENWKRKQRAARVTIFVHELPGDFPVTSRHYWLAELSKRVVRRLSRIADVLITNTEHHQAFLRRMADDRAVHLVRIGSNIEPSDDAMVERRSGEFVLFGLPFGREQTLKIFAPQIERWRAEGRLVKLHIIGPAASAPGLDAITVDHGLLPPGEISRILRAAEFGLTNATEATWSKSTTFMAYAAHGCLPIIAGPRPKTAPLSYALVADEVGRISETELDRRRFELQRWYYENADWRVTAPKIRALVSPEMVSA